MTDLGAYERLGDLSAAFDLTRKHHRRQADAVGLREALHCKAAPLSWEEYLEGAPCPGCGRPYRDDIPWDFRGTMHMTADETARYESENEIFRSLHADCHSIRHSVSGSLTTHCGRCCPSPPFSPEQREQFRHLVKREPTPRYLLMQWRLRLYCGHIVERTAHYTHKTVHAAFMDRPCIKCGLDPATIVDAEAIGLAEDPPEARKPPPPRPTRAQLEKRINDLETELETYRSAT